MSASELSHRRVFVSRFVGVVAAVTTSPLFTSKAALAQAGKAPAAPGPDDWLKDVKGTHRCLFDFPQHKNGVPLLHILKLPQHVRRGLQSCAGNGGGGGHVLRHRRAVEHRARVR